MSDFCDLSAQNLLSLSSVRPTTRCREGKTGGESRGREKEITGGAGKGELSTNPPKLPHSNNCCKSRGRLHNQKGSPSNLSQSLHKARQRVVGSRAALSQSLHTARQRVVGSRAALSQSLHKARQRVVGSRAAPFSEKKEFS